MQLWPYVKHCLHTWTDKIKPLLDLIDVKDEDKSAFFKKPTSIAMFIKQLISTASRTFKHNNIFGSESENAIELDDESEQEDNETNKLDKDELVIKKLQQFAMDMSSNDDDGLEDESDSKGIASEVETSSSKPIDTNDLSETEHSTDESNDIAARRHADIDNRNKRIMRNTIDLLECNSVNELADFAIEAMSALNNIERGSLKNHKKVKSFLRRWHEKNQMKNIVTKYQAKDEKKDTIDNDIMIERDRIIACNVEMGILNEEINEKEKIAKKLKHRTLTVFTKRHNKWFMTSEKQPWNRFMKEDELKKYRCAVRLIVDGAFEGYDDVAFDSEEWSRKHISKLITGLDVENVHNEMHNY